MMESTAEKEIRPSKALWVFAYLLSPALPFFLLRRMGAIGWRECLCGFIAGITAHSGLLGVLGETNHERLQPFVTLLMLLSLYVIILWQYLAGQRAGIWSDNAVKEWRFAGKFFGVVLFIALAGIIASFHFIQTGGTEDGTMQPVPGETSR